MNSMQRRKKISCHLATIIDVYVPHEMIIRRKYTDYWVATRIFSILAGHPCKARDVFLGEGGKMEIVEQ
jgi:hypothetical protein